LSTSRKVLRTPFHDHKKITTPQPRSSLQTNIHITGLLFCIASILWLPNVTNPLHNGVGGHFQFLTIIALTLTTLTFSVGLFGDILPSKHLFTFKSALSICTTPLEVLICTGYWLIYALDKDKVNPPTYGITLIPNLGFHAVPAVMLILDMLAGPTWMINTRAIIILDAAFFFLYWMWLEYCYSHNKW
jgi:hypothetical protein